MSSCQGHTEGSLQRFRESSVAESRPKELVPGVPHHSQECGVGGTLGSGLGSLEV